jgi:hypothetical protein
MNWLGLVAASTAFLSIWFGHVAVRKIESESRTIWLPTIAFIALGLLTEYCSLLTDNLSLSTIFGIAGITFLWDALEITRQQNRVRHGHAPANPNNPRHARILKEHPSATTVDLLNREPTGSQITGQRTL